MGVKHMKQFMSEYGWLCVSFLGGIIGIEMFFSFFVGSESSVSGVLELLLKGLM